MAQQLALIAKESAPKPVVRPGVDISFGYPQHPAPLLVNSTSAVAENVKWWVTLWNLDRPPSQPSRPWQPLLIPTQSFDYIRAKEAGGPTEIFDTPLVNNAVSVGNRLFGYAAVTCPDCLTTHFVWVYAVYGESGWYAPLPKDAAFVVPTTVYRQVPRIAADSTDALERLVPSSDRELITDSLTRSSR
jgi:hypothetical protein